VTRDDGLRDLLAKAVEGDDRAVAELVRRTQPDVWRLCCALGSAGEVEDLVQ
jgi:RNA polymerase sigma-70 factor (ECF subfamily)